MAEPMAALWRNWFLALGGECFTALPPQPLPDPHWVAVSADRTELLGLPAGWYPRLDWNRLAAFSGNARWDVACDLWPASMAGTSKLGRRTVADKDLQWASGLLRLMAAGGVDNTFTISRLAGFSAELA